MSRPTRLFEIIQLLRAAGGPLTAAAMAERLEVATRTVYRDIAALQAMRVPIEGEAGIGYVMRPGFDLPPLMFTAEEVEAITVGLALLGRTGDAGLLTAAADAGDKIAAVLAGAGAEPMRAAPLYASDWHAVPSAGVDLRRLRKAIREAEILRIDYADAAGRQTRRTVKPLAVLYYTESVVLATWCALRDDFRHFRVDRIARCHATGDRFVEDSAALRADWLAAHHLP